MPAARPWSSLSLACLLLSLWAGPALAHKVNVFAYAEGDKVNTQAYFNDGRPAQDSTIEVYDKAGKLLLSGKTNDAGEFSFPLPKVAGDLKIVLVASMGHKNEFLLAASELPQAAKREAPQPAKEAAAPKPGAPTEPAAPRPAADVAAPAALTDERLRNVVREEVDAALAARLSPLTRMLASRQREEGVRLTDVIGGIGYILGLAGVAAYFASRRRPQAKG